MGHAYSEQDMIHVQQLNAHISMGTKEYFSQFGLHSYTYINVKKKE